MPKSQNYERLGRSPGCPAPRAHSLLYFASLGGWQQLASSTATYNPVTSWLPASPRFLSSTQEHADLSFWLPWLLQQPHTHPVRLGSTMLPATRDHSAG